MQLGLVTIENETIFDHETVLYCLFVCLFVCAIGVRNNFSLKEKSGNQ